MKKVLSSASMQALVEYHIYTKPNPDYTGLANDLRALNYTDTEVWEVLHRVRLGDY